MADFNFGKMRQDAMTVLTGKFVVRCVEVAAVKNSKNDDMLKTKLEIVAGPYAGRRLFNNFNIIPSNAPALQMFFRHMNAFGLDERYFNQLPNGDAGVAAIARDLVGRVVEVDVEARPYNGVERENITAINPAPAGMGGSGAVTATALPTALPAALPVSDAAPATPNVVTGSAHVDLPMTVSDPDTVPPADENVAAATGTEPELPF